MAALLVSVQLSALTRPIAVAVLAWGMVAGWVVAWIAHRYRAATDDDGYDIAVLGDATCSHCHQVLPLGDVLPFEVFRCPHCRLPLSSSWALTQAAVVVGSLAMLVALDARVAVVAFLWLVPVLVLAAVVDARTFLIPKRVVWVGFGVGLVLISVTSIVKGHPELIRNALIGSAMYFAVLFITNLVNPAGMGFGDVRLSVLLGLYLGWLDLRLPIYGLLLASVLGVVFGLVRRATAVTEAEKAFPFGPGLAVGTLGAVFLSQTLLH